MVLLFHSSSQIYTPLKKYLARNELNMVSEEYKNLLSIWKVNPFSGLPENREIY